MQHFTTVKSVLVIGLVAAAACSNHANAYQVAPAQCPNNFVCNGTGPNAVGTMTAGRAWRGQGIIRQATFQPGIDIPLSEEEKTELLYMREEEKLARDVYQALFDRWDDQVFMIANSEQRHMDALKSLLVRYGLDDPVTDETSGVFTNPIFTQLYLDLVATGSESLGKAFVVGVTIEELDIADLQDAISVTNHQDSLIVYQNLQRASRNHLRAFGNRLPSVNLTYEPQYLSTEDFAAIISTPVEPGWSWGQGQAMVRRGRALGQGQSQPMLGRGRGLGRGQGQAMLVRGRGRGRGVAQPMVGRGQGLGQRQVQPPSGLGPCGLGPCGLGPCELGPCELGPCGLGPCELGPCELVQSMTGRAQRMSSINGRSQGPGPGSGWGPCGITGAPQASPTTWVPGQCVLSNNDNRRMMPNRRGGRRSFR